MSKNSIAVYVHYPYCVAKCRYCAFASKACEPKDLTSQYLSELKSYSDVLAGRKVSSVYFGGGTPSLMPVRSVAAVLDFLRPSGEVTLEANPATIDLAKMRALRAAGVNRLSIGVQSLNDKELEFLGRVHTARQALDTLDAARAVFENVNADFIYGLPGQSVADWAGALARIVELDLPHYSLYQLTHEKGTPIGRVKPMDEEVAAKMFLLAPKVLRQYEVSNFAGRGFEGQHNLNYWRGGEYLGIGPFAAGRIKIEGQWYETFNGSRRRLTNESRAREMVISGLRMNMGIDFALFECNSGVDFWRVVNRTMAGEFLKISLRGARVYARFRLVLDSVIRAIVEA